MRHFELRKIMKSVVITSIFLVVWGTVMINNYYSIEYDEIKSIYEKSMGFQNMKIRDKVIIENDEFLFYESEDQQFGYLHIRKGLNNKYKQSGSGTSTQYFQVVHPYIDKEAYLLIVGNNPTGEEIKCEITDRFIQSNIKVDDFMMIYKPSDNIFTSYDDIKFFDDKGEDISEIIKSR